MAIERILLTGAAGNLGRVLRRQLRGRFALVRLSDIGEMAPAEAGEEVVRCDLSDGAATQRLCAGIVESGPILPFLSNIDDRGILGAIESAAKRLREADAAA